MLFAAVRRSLLALSGHSSRAAFVRCLGKSGHCSGLVPIDRHGCQLLPCGVHHRSPTLIGQE